MKLTDQIKIRKLKFNQKIEISENTVEFISIGISILIPEGFTIDDGRIFKNFKTDYVFPENPEFSKTDKEHFEKGLFPPVFTIKKTDKRPIIACYLFRRKALKGVGNLNIRSINKLESMWAQYVAEKTNDGPMNAKRILKNGLTGALSAEYKFEYNTKSRTEHVPSNLKILTYEIKNFILTFYVIDDNLNKLEQTELDSFIDGIKTSPEKASNSLWQKVLSILNI